MDAGEGGQRLEQNEGLGCLYCKSIQELWEYRLDAGRRL